MTTKIRGVVGLLGACLALAACGEDDDPSGTAATPVPPAATTSADTTPKPGKEKTPASEKTPAPEDETPVADETPAAGATPESSQEVPEGLPSTTPEPGPPVRFNVSVTDDAVTPNVDSIPEGKSLKVYFYNRGTKDIAFNLLANGNVVGTGGVEEGKSIFVLVRNLLPGKLVIEGGTSKATVKVTPK